VVLFVFILTAYTPIVRATHAVMLVQMLNEREDEVEGREPRKLRRSEGAAT